MKFIEFTSCKEKVLLNVNNILYIKPAENGTLIKTNVPTRYGANGTNSCIILADESYDVIKGMLGQ